MIEPLIIEHQTILYKFKLMKKIEKERKEEMFHHVTQSSEEDSLDITSKLALRSLKKLMETFFISNA